MNELKWIPYSYSSESALWHNQKFVLLISIFLREPLHDFPKLSISLNDWFCTLSLSLLFYLKWWVYNQNSPYLDILCRTCNEIWNYSRFFFQCNYFFMNKHDFNKLALGVSSTLLLLYRNFKWITFPNSSWKQTEENVM